MHDLLSREVTRHFGAVDQVPARLAPFLASVDQAYDDCDAHRQVLERLLELRSRELRAATATMQGLLLALPDVYYRIDEYGTILDCRGGAEGALLRPLHTILGARLESGPDPAVAAALDSGIRTTLATGDPTTVG